MSQKGVLIMHCRVGPGSGESTLSQPVGSLSAGAGYRTPPAGRLASFDGGALYADVRQFVKRFLKVIALLLLVPTFATAGLGEKSENTAVAQVREELWGIPSIIPMLAYVIRPAGDGPFPLLVMNHGVSLDPKERSYFPVIEFRDAALWFAKQGYVIVVPVRPGYGATAIEIPERGLFGLFFSGVGNCSDANFRDAGLAIASLDMWVIDYMSTQPFIKRDDVVVVGQSGGGWGAIALASQNPKSVRAMIGFESGRGGHLNGKPNNNCAPDLLVEAAAQFGRTARIPMLWIYTHNDSYFGPDLSMRLATAFRAAGGNVEYHLVADFGEDGHFLLTLQMLCEFGRHWSANF
jgi:dienelactone hydrolase